MLAILGIVFTATLFLGFPVAVCLGITAVAGLVAMDVPLVLAAQRVFTGMDSFPLMAVPFFVLAGELMNKGGTTQRLIDFSFALVGRVRGGLAHTNVVASMFLAGISGSAVADASALGSIMIPGMERHGYSRAFASALTAAASTMGPIIPPSIFMIIMGVSTGVSVGGLFAAGIVPGVLMGLSMMAISSIVAKRRNYPRDEQPFSLKRFAAATWKGLPALLAPGIILGGILGGVFTPTEAAVVVVFYALFLGFFVYRELKLADLPRILVSTGMTTAVLLFIIAMANVFAWVLAAEQIPQGVAKGMLSISTNPMVILLIINVFLLIVGMFMEGGAAIIILAPTLMQVAKMVGIDQLHLAFIMVFNIVIGLLTPPMGVCLFVVCGIARLPLSEIMRELWPFLFTVLGLLLLATYMPAMVLTIPRMLGYL